MIPLGCLIRSPLVILALISTIGFIAWVSYTQFNWDFLGLAAPKFENWTIGPGFKEVAVSSGEHWQIGYEKNTRSTFTGLIRHISPIREPGFPLLTHDILVTSGDYADPEAVRTAVSNHRFSWTAQGKDSLSGSINLLHTVPENEEIYRMLLSLRKGDWIKISGREISAVEHYDARANLISIWTDAGCNSILVTKVERVNPPSE